MAENSLNESMDKAIKHYSSLFQLPPHRKLVSLLALICIVWALLLTVSLFQSLEGFLKGLILGVSLFFLDLFLDYTTSKGILKQDHIYDQRRTEALSLFCWGLWFLFISIGVVAALNFGLSWWIRLCLLGFSAVVILRLIVLKSTSSMSQKRIIAAAILQPLFCVAPFIALWVSVTHSAASYVLISVIFSLGVSFVSSFSFISLLNQIGEQTLGIPSLSLLKAFLLNWIAGLNAPFEEFLEKLGEKQSVEVSLIKFVSSKPQAVMAVPSIHPGPFKNIGSSLLPSMLKSALEKELDCVVCVPHGLLGHELDLASQLQNQKIISNVAESLNFKASETKATPFIKVSNGLATACCQIFGKFAFLSFTLAPMTTEDLPQELGQFVRQEAQKYGLTCGAIINAHNSIDGESTPQKALESLKTVAATCLEKAASLELSSFEVGATTVVPKEFGLKEGMGPGGITVIVVKVDGQKTAYVVADSNNMVSGLRENVLSQLNSIGFDEGEIFTTDTHAVSAVILNERGYHPLGEVISNEKLFGHIKQATLLAAANLESSAASSRSIKIPDVKVIGEKRLETLCLLIDKALQRAKRIAVPLFALSGLLLMLFFMLL